MLGIAWVLNEGQPIFFHFVEACRGDTSMGPVGEMVTMNPSSCSNCRILGFVLTRSTDSIIIYSLIWEIPWTIPPPKSIQLSSPTSEKTFNDTEICLPHNISLKKENYKPHRAQFSAGASLPKTSLKLIHRNLSLHFPILYTMMIETQISKPL